MVPTLSAQTRPKKSALQGGVSKRLVNFAISLVCALPGGLAIVGIVASLFFGALSGSSTATVADIGSIVVPYMLEAGCSLRFSLAAVASAGFLGVIILGGIYGGTFTAAESGCIACFYGLLVGVLRRSG